MLGEPGRGPISTGNGIGRQLALIVAVLLVLGGGYVAWFGPPPALNFGQLVSPVEVSALPTPAAKNPVVVLPGLPEPRASYVVDGSKLLSGEALANLNLVLTDLNLQAGPQLIVMTVPSLGGVSIDDYARRIANQWAIGDPTRKDGVLLLVAPTEKKVRIEVASGLTATLSNADCQRIIDQVMVPLFRQDRYEQATVAGALALTKHLRANPTLPQPLIPLKGR